MQKTVAYFASEYSVADSLPIYAGGLGILAGDTVMEAGAEGRDFHALGLVYHEAFTPGDTDHRPMVERLRTEGFEVISETIGGKPIILTIPLGNDKVSVQAWRKSYGTSSLILLDTRLPTNSTEDWRITNHLYDSTPGMMLRQQLVLAFGGVAILARLGIEPDFYHLNEGHMSFVGIAAAIHHQKGHRQMHFSRALETIKPKLVASKHTILPGAGLTIDRTTLEKELGKLLSHHHGKVDDLMKLGGKKDGFFSTTQFLLAIASRSSGVSKIHVRSEAAAHPGSPLVPVTNGIYEQRWKAATWPRSPVELDDLAFWEVHRENRHKLLEYVKEETGKALNMHHLTIVWARRMTAYKRPELIVNDLQRLIRLMNNHEQPVQLIVAGQANPTDNTGIELMNRVITTAQRPELGNSFAYLPHYNPMTARLLVQGADLWLNTPIRGQEACGTSGMKASLNGALQFSTSDGWVDEVEVGPIGWVLPVDGAEAAIYDIIEQEIAPLFYDRSKKGIPTAWIRKMHANIELIQHEFTAARMLQGYYTKLYHD